MFPSLILYFPLCRKKYMNMAYNLYGAKTVFVMDCSGDRKIQVSEDRRLNIYIALDVSERIEEKHIIESKEAVIKLITKVRNKQVSCP